MISHKPKSDQMPYSSIFSTIAVFLLCFSLSACDSPEQKEAKYIDRGNKLFEQGDLVKARLEYKNAARISPTDPEARYRLALIDEAEGNIGAAVKGFLTAEQQNAHFEPAVFKLAQYLLAAERYDDVRKRIDLLLADNPDNAQAHALRAALLLRLKNPSTAEKEVRIAFEKDPNNIIGFSVLTGIYVAQKDFTKALSTVDDGIAHNPKELSLVILKAMVYGQMEDVQKIAETYGAIFKLRPNEVGFHFELADIFTKANKIEEAENTLRNAVTTFPDNWEVKRRLANFLSNQKDMDVAEKEIRNYMKTAPEKNELYLWLADIYMKHNASDRAVALLEEIVDKDTNVQAGLNARTSLATIKFIQGNRDVAEKLVNIVLSKDSNNTEALFMRARLAFERGDYQKSVSDLRTIVRDKPRTTKALQLLTETFLNQGHTDLAIDTLNQLLNVDPVDLKARIRLAQMYGLQGDSRHALEMLSIVTKSDPNYSVGWESTARIAIDAKNWALAEEAIGKLDAMENQHLTALFLKAQVLSATDKREESLPLYEQVITADPSAPLSEHALSALVKVARDIKKLPEIITYITALKSDSGVVSSILGETLLATGKINEAAQAFDIAIEKKVTFQDPYMNRAKIFAKEGQIDQALLTLGKAESVAPADFRAFLMAADILLSQGKVDDVINIYETLLAHNPALDIAANNLAQIIADNKYDDAAAMEKARVAAERFSNTNNPYFLDTLGWVYLRQGKITQAQPIIERAMSLSNPVLPQMQYHYGSLLVKTERKEEAKVVLSKAIIDGASYSGLEDAKKLLKTIE